MGLGHAAAVFALVPGELLLLVAAAPLSALAPEPRDVVGCVLYFAAQGVLVVDCILVHQERRDRNRIWASWPICFGGWDHRSDDVDSAFFGFSSFWHDLTAGWYDFGASAWATLG